jgi:hypothetical protein
VPWTARHGIKNAEIDAGIRKGRRVKRLRAATFYLRRKEGVTRGKKSGEGEKMFIWGENFQNER